MVNAFHRNVWSRYCAGRDGSIGKHTQQHGVVSISAPSGDGGGGGGGGGGGAGRMPGSSHI